MIEFKHVSFSYGTEPVLNSLSTKIVGTAPLAIIGQNGSGKTTLVKLLNGLLRPNQGKVLIEGVDVASQTVAEWSKKVGYVFQHPEDQLFLETVEKEIRFGPEKIGMAPKAIDLAVEKSLALTGLSQERQTHPFELSPTAKKFCGIAAVLAMDPAIYIFDEPTMGQDARGKDRLAQLIATLHEQGKLVIMISHDIPFVIQTVKRVMVLVKGRLLLEGGVAYVFSKEGLLEQAQIRLPEVSLMGKKAGLTKTYLRVGDLLAQIELAQASRDDARKGW
nr:ABC transporter ATP-binding protein [uncultured Vagococcus sp.]